MTLLKNILFLLIATFFISTGLIAQICISYKLPNTNLLMGDECSIIVWVKNVPGNAKVKVLCNNEDAGFKKDSVAIHFADDSTISWHENEIIVIVTQNGKIIHKEIKAANYARSISKVAFDNRFGDILYKGIGNEILIAASGVVDHELTISPGRGLSLRKSGNGLFKATVDPKFIANDEVQIVIHRKLNDGGVQLLAQKNFRALELPIPICKLSTPLENLSDKDTMTLQCIVQDNLKGSIWPKIEQYKCLIFTNGLWQTFTNVGEKINGELLALLKTLKKGDIVNFEKIEIVQVPGLPVCKTSLCLLKQ